MPTYEIQLKECRRYTVEITAPNGEKAYEAFMERYETHAAPENEVAINAEIIVKLRTQNEYGALPRKVKTK